MRTGGRVHLANIGDSQAPAPCSPDALCRRPVREHRAHAARPGYGGIALFTGRRVPAWPACAWRSALQRRPWVDVGDEGDVDDAGPARHLGEVLDPPPVRGQGGEVPLEQFVGVVMPLIAEPWCASCGRCALPGCRTPASVAPPGTMARRCPSVQLEPDHDRAVDPVVLLPGTGEAAHRARPVPRAAGTSPRSKCSVRSASRAH
jgi:hypothetical protein